MLTSPRWYLLQCKAQQQARAELNLTHQGFTYYSPLHTVKRLARGRVETRTEALFPGYAFINLSDESKWGALRSTRGVSRIVSFNGTPHPVPDSLISALQQRLATPAAPAALFSRGERVVITEGCFKHIEAIVKGVTADERIIVLLKILQTEQALEMTPAQLARAS
jgi:transcriptional antiterminator RfaH